MIKILHAADFHLDSAFSSLDGQQRLVRRGEQRKALEQLSRFAKGCDLILLPGDLFDGRKIYRETTEALKRFFASVEGQVFIAPGNHDYITVNSPYSMENWGDNVHIFTEPTVECVSLPSLNCDVYGAAFNAMEMPPLMEGFHVRNEDRINLMVLHGEVGRSVYNGITEETIRASGLDYLALGHNHSAGAVRVGKTLCAWPGCLSGRGFDECGQKGVYRVTVEKGNAQEEYLPIITRKYEILDLNVNNSPESALQELVENRDTEKDSYRIRLVGEGTADAAELEKKYASRFYSLSIVDDTRPAEEDLFAAVSEDTLRGLALKELKARYEAGDEAAKEKILMAARLLRDLMDGREVML